MVAARDPAAILPPLTGPPGARVCVSLAIGGCIVYAALLLGGGAIYAQETGQGVEGRPGDTTVVSVSSKVQVKLGGRVHRMSQLVADGRETDVFFTDNDPFPTMLRVDATAQMGDKLTVGGALEIGFQQNRPLFVSQDNPDIDIDVTGRMAEIYAAGKVGTFSLGRGYMASWVTPEIDLSGTQRASLLAIGALFGGLKFVDATTNELTDIRVRTHHADTERLLIKDRLRYDSPRLLGLQVSASLAAADRRDVALRIRRDVGDFTLAGAATYQHKPFGDLDWRSEAGVSFRHEPTGLNATVAGFTQRPPDGRNAHGRIVKIGWLAGLAPIGKTAFSADVASNFNIAIDGDDGVSFGVFALQNWDQLGIRAYIGIRQYELDRPDINLKRITIVPFGALIRF